MYEYNTTATFSVSAASREEAVQKLRDLIQFAIQFATDHAGDSKEEGREMRKTLSSAYYEAPE